MGRFGWLRLASRSLALRSSEVAAQRSTWIRPNTPCSSTGIYIGDRCYGRFMLTSFVLSRFFHATGHCCSIHKDYYKILGVPKDASQDDIKKAFHSLAKKYHPDTNRGNTAAKRMFQEIRDAYETLRDPSKREQYDMLFSRGSRGEFDGSSHQNSDPFTEFYRQNDGPFSSKFYKIFSEVFQHDVNIHAHDVEVEMNLSFSEAANGCIKQVSFSAKNVCDSCDGRGYLANAKRYVCPSCKGLGRVTMYPFTSICSSCRGVGKVIKDYCLACKGSGVVDGMKYVNVTIPAGVDSGDTIHVPEAGNSGGLGAQPGSLYIKLQVAIDPVFVRDGADIHVEKRISFTQAILGGKVEVPTLNGKTEVKIPKGVQSGQVLVLRGKGLPNLAGYSGDQYVRFRIHFPSVVTERQRALLEEFAVEEATKEQNTSVAGNWWELVAENITAQNLMIGVGILLLIHLILNKAVS
ncbi:chaperone protein dnaJ 1, mitochondrial-like [Phragmites australis]|uniref:chaperone protein dnaJ 1, mitochondrial-like n=1 Tax=Phragmites australis TaxID=29695 RepID=UPI002D783CEB|nr:chaperone protein dnaJ 1, mitochondrial-like [Phragmites australis]